MERCVGGLSVAECQDLAGLGAQSTAPRGGVYEEEVQNPFGKKGNQLREAVRFRPSFGPQASEACCHLCMKTTEQRTDWWRVRGWEAMSKIWQLTPSSSNRSNLKALKEGDFE